MVITKSNTERVRCSKKFKILLREAQLEYIKKGKKPPSDTKLTELIAKKIKKEDILYEGFIPF